MTTPLGSGTSLRTKVPLYLCGGLLLLMASWTWISYRNLRDAMAETGEQRLAAVASQFAEMYETQARTYATNMQTAATRPEFVRFVSGRGGRDSVLSTLTRMLTRSNRRATLFALDGTPLLSMPDSQANGPVEKHGELADEFARLARGPERATVAPFRILNDSVMLPVVSAVLRDSQPIGFVALWRNSTATPQALKTVAGLVGANARIYFGNARGDLWADLTGPPTQLPVTMPLDGRSMHYSRADGTEVIAAARIIPGTPWALTVEFAASAIMAPADQFLRRSIVLGITVLAFATLAAWLLSRRITTPLHELTQAAIAVAQGDRTRNVKSDRTDEIGQLATSFNRMVAHVDASQHALEDKVDDRTRQLQDRNEELEAFAHSVSHDLRAPLRAMHGFSQALLEDCGDELGPTGTDYAKRIAAASQRMDLLTQDLLAYSRVSRTDMALTPLDLAGVANGALAQLEADIATRQARITVQEVMPRALGHRAILEQIVANLVANALKFVQVGRRPEINIFAERANGVVRLWVEDNGIGIDPAHHQRIFSVFERLHQSDQYAGTGIGLAIVRKGVERMGGHVGVDSKLSGGSRFWIELNSAEG